MDGEHRKINYAEKPFHIATDIYKTIVKNTHITLKDEQKNILRALAIMLVSSTLLYMYPLGSVENTVDDMFHTITVSLPFFFFLMVLIENIPKREKKDEERKP